MLVSVLTTTTSPLCHQIEPSCGTAGLRSKHSNQGEATERQTSGSLPEQREGCFLCEPSQGQEDSRGDQVVTKCQPHEGYNIHTLIGMFPLSSQHLLSVLPLGKRRCETSVTYDHDIWAVTLLWSFYLRDNIYLATKHGRPKRTINKNAHFGRDTLLNCLFGLRFNCDQQCNDFPTKMLGNNCKDKILCAKYPCLDGVWTHSTGFHDLWIKDTSP